MAQLNSAQSIIDFTKSRNLPSDFDSRKKLFIQSGLNPEGDEYRGTPNENVNFLNYLASREKESGVQISPQNIYDVIKARQASPVSAPATEAPITEDTTDYSSIFETLSSGDLANKAIEDFTSGATFPLKQESAEAEKAAEVLKGQQSKEKLISDLASRGLFFSGKKDVGLAEIDAETLASVLGVDRKFALMVAQGLESSAEKIAKEAQAGNQKALDSLEAMGYTIDPISGRIVPTLAREKSEKEVDKVLSPTEAATLGVPYGTTEKQAAGMNITPARYKETSGEKTVPFSQWAAERGLVGMPLEDGMKIAQQEAQDEKKDIHERELASVKSNIFDYISQYKAAKGKGILSRETLIGELAKDHKNLTVQEVATEVYGLTKELEKKK